jgi:hypothetical protein
VYNEDEEKNVAPYVVFLSCYRIRENEDVKKDVFFFFFALSIRAHHHRIHIHTDIHHKSYEALVKSNMTIDIQSSPFLIFQLYIFTSIPMMMIYFSLINFFP